MPDDAATPTYEPDLDEAARSLMDDQLGYLMDYLNDGITDEGLVALCELPDSCAALREVARLVHRTIHDENYPYPVDA